MTWCLPASGPHVVNWLSTEPYFTVHVTWLQRRAHHPCFSCLSLKIMSWAKPLIFVSVKPIMDNSAQFLLYLVQYLRQLCLYSLIWVCYHRAPPYLIHKYLRFWQCVSPKHKLSKYFLCFLVAKLRALKKKSIKCSFEDVAMSSYETLSIMCDNNRFTSLIFSPANGKNVDSHYFPSSHTPLFSVFPQDCNNFACP